MTEPLPPRLPKRTQVWRCRVCSYGWNSGDTCLNCSRDFWGREGNTPSFIPVTPGLGDRNAAPEE